MTGVLYEEEVRTRHTQRGRPARIQGEGSCPHAKLPKPASGLPVSITMRKYTLSEQLRLMLGTRASLWGAGEPCGQPGPLQGRGSCGERSGQVWLHGVIFPQSHYTPQLDFQTGHLGSRVPRLRPMEGFISRQRRTKAISPDTNIDEYVYGSPQTGKLKQGWGRRASRTPVDGFSQPGGRAHQICHHDTLLRNCSLYPYPGGGGGGGDGRRGCGPTELGTPGVGMAPVQIYLGLGRKGVVGLGNMGTWGGQEAGEGLSLPPCTPKLSDPREQRQATPRRCLCCLPKQGAGAA